MPTYAHKCPGCEHQFEDFRKIKDYAKNPKCPECGHKKCPQVFSSTGRPGDVKVISKGDTTTAVYGDDGKPYRFKTGTEKEQKQELQNILNEREASVPEKYRRVYDVT